MTRLALFFAVLCLAAGKAAAQTPPHYWLVNGDGASAMVAGIENRTGPEVRAVTWLIEGIPSDPSGSVESEETLWAVDCHARTLSELAWLRRNGRGEIADGEAPAEPSVEPVASGTVGRAFVDVVCADEARRAKLALALSSLAPSVRDPVALGEAYIAASRAAAGNRQVPAPVTLAGATPDGSMKKPTGPPGPNVPKYFNPGP
ncbi:MAG: hypothetical protein ACRED9_11940 [Caulobacteraceae bacterium]